MFKRRRINNAEDYAYSSGTDAGLNSPSNASSGLPSTMAPILNALEQIMGFMQAAMQELMESNVRIETKIQAIDAQLAKQSNIIALLTKEIADLQIHALHGMMTGGAGGEEPAPYMHF